MTISREEIVREFIESIDGLPRLLTVTEAADVTERLIARAVEIDSDPNAKGTAAFGGNAIQKYALLVAKLAEVLPGPRGREVLFTSEERLVLDQALTYAGSDRGEVR